MKVAEFDTFADEYHEQHKLNIAISGEGPEYFSEYKITALAEICAKVDKRGNGILDFGSGIGNSTPFIRTQFPEVRLTSADVSKRSLEIAEGRFPGLSHHLLIEGNAIPAEDSQFDIVFSACVFHHIPHEEHVHWLTELRRVTRMGGRLVIFEHNPLNPLTVRAVNTCPFDANARLIKARAFASSYQRAGWSDIELRYHLFFPRLLSRLRFLDPHLRHVFLGAQYSIAATKTE